MNPHTPHRVCPACAGDHPVDLEMYSPDPWVIVECGSCAFVYLKNPPGYEALKEDFAWETTYAAKKESSKGSTVFSPMARKLRNALGMYRDQNRLFRRYFGNSGKVLDVGSGMGTRISAPQIPFGIELSSGLHKQSDALMKTQGGYCIHGAGADAIWNFDPGMFDGIVMFSYLEHESEVLKVLRGAHRALNNEGGVFVRVPNFASLNRRVIGPKWCGFRYPDHVNYFTLQSLRDIAHRAQFTVQLINKVTLPVDDNISVLLRKSNTL